MTNSSQTCSPQSVPSDASFSDAPLRISAVAFFSEVYTPIVNGVVASIAALRDGLRATDVDVTIVAPAFARSHDDDASIVRLPSLPLPTSTGYRLCSPYLTRAARERLTRAQIVHVHSPFVTGMLGADIARRRGIPLVFTYHTRIDEYAHYAPFETRSVRRALVALTRAFANRAATVIVPSHAMHDRLREIGVRVPIAIVPSAIDAERFARGSRTDLARALFGARSGARVALIVARLAKEKQLERAIDALAHARELHLAIAGEGPHRAALIARAQRAGVHDRVTFMGALPPHVLPDVYASSDVFAFPSTTETQGLVLAEAQASGLPVVAIENPVNREMLGGRGRFVAPDPAAFAAALTDAANGPRDPEGAAAAAVRFGRARQTEAIMNVYRAISVCRTFGTLVGDHALG